MPDNIPAARRLRREATEAEKRLWARLRDHRLAGCKFTFQKPIGGAVADFACHAARLVVEVDGGRHDANAAKDAARTAALQREGWQVIRFWNNQIFENLDGVLERITQELNLALNR